MSIIGGPCGLGGCNGHAGEFAPQWLLSGVLEMEDHHCFS
jgi:hypothetical protein